MNIFVESVSVEEIRRAVAQGLADGVVVSDALYAGSESVEGRELIEAVAHEFAIPICVEVRAISGDEMYREAKDLSRISDHLVIQLPLVEDAVEPMHRLSHEGVDICANFVFNGAQAVLAAKAGASMVRVSLHDLVRFCSPAHASAMSWSRRLRRALSSPNALRPARRLCRSDPMYCRISFFTH